MCERRELATACKTFSGELVFALDAVTARVTIDRQEKQNIALSITVTVGMSSLLLLVLYGVFCANFEFFVCHKCD